MTITWNGGSGSWTTASNWSGNAAPIITDDVLFSNTAGPTSIATLDVSGLIANSVTIVATAGSQIALFAGGSLAVTNNVSLSSASNTKFALISGVGALQVGGTVIGTGTISANGGSLGVTGSIVAAAAGATTGVALAASGTSGLLTLNLRGTGNQVRALAIAGTGSVIKLSAGSLSVTGTGAYTGNSITTPGTIIDGGIQVAGGTLQIATGVTLANTASISVTSGSLDLEGGGVLGGLGVILSDTAGVAMTVGGVALATGGTISFAGIANGAQLKDTVAGGGLANVLIAGFGGSDRIDIANAATVTNTIGNTWVVKDSGGVTLDTLVFTTAQALSVVGSGSSAAVACYLAGTHVQTLAGAVAVEDLRIGDLVATATGPQPIRWIGTRAYLATLINQHHRDALMPIRFSAGSLGGHIPARDLFVSPEHMMVLDGALVAAHNLLNGTTITRATNIDVIRYFHIELPTHAIMFAEGAAAESYLDTGNRNMFSNVLEYAERGLPVGDATPCLPIVSEGPALAAIRAGLAARAEACGFGHTADADLHLLVDGVAVYPTAVDRGTSRFEIAGPSLDVRIVSRSAVPAESDPASGDRRRLGVAIAGLAITGGGLALDLLANEPRLADGFHAVESNHRWTDGNAAVPAALLGLMSGPFILDVRIAGTEMRYPVDVRSEIVTLASARKAALAPHQKIA